MKILIKATISLVIFSVFGFAVETVKTQEQANDEVIARIAGTSLRQTKQSKEQCFKLFEGENAQACLKGYEEADINLNKPAK